MITKTFKTSALLALSAVALIGSTMAAAVSVATVDPMAGTETGLLKPWPEEYSTGDTIQLATNFPSGKFHMSVYARTPGGEWAHLEPKSNFYYKKAKSNGNLVLNGYEVGATQELVVRTTLGTRSNVITINGDGEEDPTETPAPSPSPSEPAPSALTHVDAKTFTATFSPKKPGQASRLEWKTIKTKETNETPESTWVSIKTGKQDANGKTVFTISDPREVSHEYRAVSGSTTTEIVNAAAPRPTKDTGLPQVYFDSYEGAAINTRSRYFEGEFTMKGGETLSECADVAPVVKSTMKGRGNYSWSFEKKSFTLKIDKSTNLCDMGKSKKWALVANHYDRSLLRNPVAYWVGRQFERPAGTGMGWSPDEVPVDFFMNGSYRGTYMLVERVAATDPGKPASDQRLSIPENEDGESPEDAGYVLEWDFRKGAFRNFEVGNRGWIGIKEPEDEAWSQGHSNYIDSYVNDCHDKLFGGSFTSVTDGWRSCIDGSSAVDYYLAMEYLKPVDGNMWASVYMYKGPGQKLRMGPMWDFDMGLGSADRAGGVVNWYSYYLRNNLNISAMQPETAKTKPDTWFNRLNEDPTFRTAVRNRWNQMRSDDKLDPSSFIATRRGQMKDSVTENYKVWSYSKKISEHQKIESSWSKDVERLERWMDLRAEWLDNNL